MTDGRMFEVDNEERMDKGSMVAAEVELDPRNRE